MPELADGWIALDCHVDQLAAPFLDPADINGKDQVAVFVEFARPARRLTQRQGADRLDQRVTIIDLDSGTASGRITLGNA